MKKVHILLAIALLSVGALLGQTEKKVNNSFSVGEAGSLTIKNSFGDINIEPFDGDRIEVEVTITIETRNEKDVQKYLDRIRIDASETGNDVTLRTINNMNGGNRVKEFSIDYDVRVPRKTSLEIRNTFGDLMIESSEGILDIDVQHGDAFIGGASARQERMHDLRLQFGDLNIEEISGADIKVQHGDFIIERMGSGDIDLSFGEGRIERLSGRINLDIKHSELKVEEVLSDLDDLNVELQFSEFRATGFQNSDYEIDMEGSFTDFDFRGNFTIKGREKGMNSESYLVFTGQELNAKKVRIRGSHSDVNIE